jgi:predicted dehydrogenase
MNPPVPVGVIGGGAGAAELVHHAAPALGARLAAWAPASPSEVVAGLAAAAGADVVQDWRPLAGDPSLPVVLVLADLHERAAPVRAALQSGKLVLCPFPVTEDAAALAVIEQAETAGGRLRLSGGLADTHAGESLLQAMRDGRLGTVHSLWASARRRRDPAAGDVREAMLWPLLDLVLEAVPSLPRRLHTTVGTLFGPGQAADSAIVLLRFAEGPVTTLEVSRCLPPALAAADAGEVEIEAIGAREAVRITPYASGVQVLGGTMPGKRSWIDPPLSRALEQVPDLLRASARIPGWAERHRRAFAIMAAVRVGGTHAL